MKFFALIAIATTAFSAVSTATDIVIIEPWSDSVWSANKTGVIKWTSTEAVASKSCAIHLLTGPAENAIIVANITHNGFVPCGYNEISIHSLPNYPTGDYFIRLGPHDETTNNWGYSGHFAFHGLNDTVSSST